MPNVSPNQTPQRIRLPRCDAVGCRKRKLTNTACPRCDVVVCSYHTMPERHECSFDYKKLAKDRLKKENPVIGNNRGLVRI